MPVKKNIQLQIEDSTAQLELRSIQESIGKYKDDILALPDGHIIYKAMSEWINSSFTLSNQEINSLLAYKDIKTQVLFLAHRIRFTYFPQNKITSSIPPYLLIEPTSVCNMRCPMCFQSDKSFTTKGYMGSIGLEMYKQLIDEAATLGIGAITLASRGEPTLHPNLVELIRYASGKFFEIKINTNASRLTEEVIHELFRSEVSMVVFSVDSHDPDEYERIRKGGKFKEVFNNIKRFREISEEYPESRLQSRISGVRFLESQDQSAFEKFWSPFVDDVILNNAEERWDTYNNEVDTSCGTCIYPFERLYVWHDGTFNPCDVDYKSHLSPGCYTSGISINDAWSSTQLQDLRDAHRTNGLRGRKFPCDRCGVSHESE